MKKRILSLVFITTLLFSTFSAHSAYERGEEILWDCDPENFDSKDFETILKTTRCMGYVSGILDGAQLVFGLKPESRMFCPPDAGISIDQQLRIVRKFLEENPEDLHESGRMSVLLAFQLAFPCK